MNDHRTHGAVAATPTTTNGAGRAPTKVKVAAHEAHAAVRADETDHVVLRFADSATVAFAQTSDGIEVTIKAKPLPLHEQMFDRDFVDHLRELGVGGYALDLMHDAAVDALRRAQALDALMDTLKK